MGKEAESKGLLLRALAVYKQGLKLEPSSQELISSVERIEAQLQKAEQDGSLHVNRKQPPAEDAETMFKQAEVYVKYGLTAKAIEHLDALLAKHPSHARAKALRATLS